MTFPTVSPRILGLAALVALAPATGHAIAIFDDTVFYPVVATEGTTDSAPLFAAIRYNATTEEYLLFANASDSFRTIEVTNEVTKTSNDIIPSYVPVNQFVQLFLYDYATASFTGYVDHLNQY